MRKETPPIPDEWLRPAGQAEDWRVLQHNMRQLGAIATHNALKGRTPRR